MAAASYRETVCGGRGRREIEKGGGTGGGGREREERQGGGEARIVSLSAYSDKSNGKKEIPVDPVLRHMLLVINTLHCHQPEYTNHQQW